MLASWHRLGLVLLGLIFASGQVAFAQIDPEQRQLIQLGYNQPLEGRGPISGYAYYYLNQPGFLATNVTLRLAVAPVYLDSELGFAGVLGPNTDLGLGIAGGGFADTYSEIRQGRYLQSESFTGHGGEVSLSLYHLFNPGQLVPLYGVLRVAEHGSFYERDPETAKNFELPENQYALHVRAGVRWGGREPLIWPKVAMELSAWYEGVYRSNPGSYGFADDREVEGYSHQFWARALLTYTLPNARHNFSFSLTAGTSLETDRFSAYRIGSVLPMASEFPLTLPGYYFQELSARRFVLFSAYYSVPLNHNNHWNFTTMATTACMDYAPGLSQPGNWHSGVGGGFGYTSPRGTWQVLIGYAYGVDSIRDHGRGSNSIGILCQVDLGARKRDRATVPSPDIPDKSRGLFHLFN